MCNGERHKKDQLQEFKAHLKWHTWEKDKLSVPWRYQVKTRIRTALQDTLCGQTKLVCYRKRGEITWHISDSRLIVEMELPYVNFTSVNNNVVLFWFPCNFLTNYLTKYFFHKACSQKGLLKFESKAVVDLKNRKEGNYHPSVLEICLQCKKLIRRQDFKSWVNSFKNQSQYYRTRWQHILRSSTSIQEVSFFHL